MAHLNSKLPADESEQLLIKSQENTNPNYGCEPEKRDIETYLQYGAINLDKPSGPTSHEVVTWVRKLLNISNAGHGGTLDPKVTGVLPCALGKATRVLGALLTAGKEYVGVMYLHDLSRIVANELNIELKVVEDMPKNKRQKVVNKVVKKAFKIFTNEIYQRPPLKSSVARKLRIRRIYYCKLLELNENRVLFIIGCEAGTYIRKFCFDIGEALCAGAHMTDLRRTRVGKFTEKDNLITLQNLKDAFTIYQKEGNDYYLRKIVFPMEKMVEHIPKIFVRDTAVDALCHGADLAAAGVCYIDARIKVGMMIALMTLKKELIGFSIAKLDAMDIFKAKSGIMAKIKKVFMARNTYPRWDEKNSKNS